MERQELIDMLLLGQADRSAINSHDKKQRKQISALTKRVNELEQTKKRLLNEVWHNRDKERARVKALVDAVRNEIYRVNTPVTSTLFDALAEYEKGKSDEPEDD